MSFRPGATILHASAAAIMSYGYMGLSSLVIDEWVSTQKGGHFQFLTIQGLSAAWLTMIISLAGDLFPSLTGVRFIKRALFMVALPLAVVVSSIYWSLITFAPALILQAARDSEPSSSSNAPGLAQIPLSVDLALHATPAITLLVDFLFFERKYSKSEVRFAPLVVAAAALWYGNWVEYCASFNNTFPYPFLTENPLEIRVTIYIGAATLALVSFWIINGLHPRG